MIRSRSFLQFFIALAAALSLASCGTAPTGQSEEAKALAFPQPPDEPRFYYERSIYSDADVVAKDREQGLVRMLTGEAQGGTRLGKPYAITAHGGRVYVSDTTARAVHVFDFWRKSYRQITDSLNGSLSKPLGVETDPAGNLYVADVTLQAVNVYDPEGNFVRQIGEKGDFDRPAGLAVDPQGERLYVVDIGGVNSENHRVRVFDLRTDRHLLDIGKRGDADGELNLPRDVAIGPDGLVYVVDGANFRIQVFDREGNFVRGWGQAGRQVGQFARPKELAVDPGGNVYVIDTAFGNFKIFSPTGEILLYIGKREATDGPASYFLPSGIAVDGDGRVYVVDQYFAKVDIFRPASLAEGAGALFNPPPVPAQAAGSAAAK